MTEYKIIIENGQISLYDHIGDNDYIISSEKIKMSKSEKIKKISGKTIKSATLTQCRKIRNPLATLSKVELTLVIRKVYSKIEINEEEYCMIGKTELLEYLNKNYKLNIVWETEVFE